MSFDDPAFYVWQRVGEHLVDVVNASTAVKAAEIYAMRHRVPFNIALRVVPVDAVTSFGIRVERGSACS